MIEETLDYFNKQTETRPKNLKKKIPKILPKKPQKSAENHPKQKQHHTQFQEIT